MLRWAVETLIVVSTVVIAVCWAFCLVSCLILAFRKWASDICARHHLVSATGAALLAFAVGMTSAVAKRTGTTGVSPVAWTAAGTAAPHMESLHLGGDVRSGASDFWLSQIDPSSNSVALGVAWLPGAFVAPPFIEFFVNTNLAVEAWTLLGWAEAEAGETNLCVDVEAARLPGGMMPPAAFFRATAYDGLGADCEDDDGDGIPNGWESSHGTNPLRADTDGDGIPDGEEASWASIGGVYPDLDVLTRRTWLPNDWNNGTGVRFYAPRQIHGELIKRLLMSGYGSEAKSDIPYGDVHGRPKQGESTLLAIGRNNLLSFDLRSM